MTHQPHTSSESNSSTSTMNNILKTYTSYETTIPTGIETISQDNSFSQNFDNGRDPTVNITKPFPDLQPPNFVWGSCSGEIYRMRINMAYEEVVHRRRNLFQVPSGSTGKLFVS